MAKPKQSLTRDESYLCKLAKMAEASGDKFQEQEIYEVGQAMGQNNRSVDNIVRMLAQTNFVKKGDEGKIYITPHGLSLVEQLSKAGS
jgi:predicted transcriptional regulator